MVEEVRGAVEPLGAHKGLPLTSSPPPSCDRVSISGNIEGLSLIDPTKVQLTGTEKKSKRNPLVNPLPLTLLPGPLGIITNNLQPSLQIKPEKTDSLNHK